MSFIHINVKILNRQSNFNKTAQLFVFRTVFFIRKWFINHTKTNNTAKEIRIFKVGFVNSIQMNRLQLLHGKKCPSETTIHTWQYSTVLKIQGKLYLSLGSNKYQELITRCKSTTFILFVGKCA